MLLSRTCGGLPRGWYPSSGLYSPILSPTGPANMWRQAPEPLSVAPGPAEGLSGVFDGPESRRWPAPINESVLALPLHSILAPGLCARPSLDMCCCLPRGQYP